ncbi:hypothetical protein DPX16_1189 [Anabarilius grahami]|uniref:Uncharacterized protein n=1 Tax=Anabarilius grahami TaxID=495550 RepID=A0A3N0YVU4_ANAGA|nr:hypothetical protein DPX16_1189 [Anabarilius grahami]
MPVGSCPLCLRMYARPSQHLVVTHHVKNKEERKLLLSLESGRVNVCERRCPVPGCGKLTSRLDRHIQTHSDLSMTARMDAVLSCKRKKVLSQLSALRASNPEVPMVSSLDLEEEPKSEDTSMSLDEEESEEEQCVSAACKSQTDQLKSQISDLNLQLDTLTEALHKVTCRYLRLKRRSAAVGSTRIKQETQRLFLSPGPEEERDETCAPARPLSEPYEEPSVLRGRKSHLSLCL